MLRDLRRLIPALAMAVALALTGVVLTQGPASACRCATTGVDGAIDRADLVFTGTVLSSSRQGDRTRYRVDAETLYRGDLMSGKVVVTSPGTSCALRSVETDERYLWFVDERRGTLTATQCSGVDRATDRRVAQVEDVLGEGEPLDAARAESAPAEFTRVADAEPRPLTRVAAPGVALVLLGLLGLLVVRRRARKD